MLLDEGFLNQSISNVADAMRYDISSLPEISIECVMNTSYLTAIRMEWFQLYTCFLDSLF